jgi:hypothetical protein
MAVTLTIHQRALAVLRAPRGQVYRFPNQDAADRLFSALDGAQRSPAVTPAQRQNARNALLRLQHGAPSYTITLR